jgi:hypothetical protein
MWQQSFFENPFEPQLGRSDIIHLLFFAAVVEELLEGELVVRVEYTKTGCYGVYLLP